MKIGFIGLGRMGHNMVLHLLENNIEVCVYNRSPEKIESLKKDVSNLKSQISNFKSENVTVAGSISELIDSLRAPKIVWLMVAAGKAVDDVIDELLKSGLSEGDIVIDGGNSFYKDSVRRFNFLKEKGIHFLDIGTSGGLDGARNGACIMVGGEKEIYDTISPILDGMVGKIGTHTYFGESGAGHFVKMVHNGVEYGMLQSIGEGFELLYQSSYKVDLKSVSQNWIHGSVVRGWLMELLDKYLESDSKLTQAKGAIGGGETGEWTLLTAKEFGVSIPVIEAATEYRKKTVEKPTFAGQIISAIRWMFGRHEK